MSGDDRRSEPRQKLGVSDELTTALARLDETHPDIAATFRLAWRDMSGYAIDNGHRLDREHRTVQRMTRVIIGGLAGIAAVVAAIGVISIILLGDQGHTTTRLKASIQTSRFDGAYASCIRVNTRHQQVLSQLNLASPGGSSAEELLFARVFAPIKAAILATSPYHSNCTLFAQQQTALSIPGPKPPSQK